MSTTEEKVKSKAKEPLSEEALLKKKKKKEEKKKLKGAAGSGELETKKKKKKKKEGATAESGSGITGEEKKKKKKKVKKTADADDGGEAKKEKKKKKRSVTPTEADRLTVQQLVKDVQHPTKASDLAPKPADDSDDEGDAASYPTETSQEKALRIIKETKDNARYAIALTSLQLDDGQFPEEFSDLEDVVTSVDLSFNLLVDIPMPILLLSNLQKLKMQSNVLERLSILRGAFGSLQELDLNGNNLASLPPEIGYLANLRIFDASNNRLESLPPEIGALNKLEEFRLAGNPLRELPKTIGNLGRLEVLDLVNCKLKQLPDQITYLSKLAELDVSANQLESLPAAFGLLPRLGDFKATNNSLKDLPVSVACIPHLQRMALNGNEFVDDDLAVFAIRSSNALLSFLKERLTTSVGDLKKVRDYMKELGEQREPLIQVIAPQDGEGGFEVKEKLSAEKESQKKAETEKKDTVLRDKILHLKKLSVDQYSRINEWVFEMKSRNWAQNGPQDSINLATYVGLLKNHMDALKERIVPFLTENYKTVQAQEGDDKMLLLKKSVDVSLDNVSVVVRALMKGIREESDLGKVVLLVKDLMAFYDHFGKYFGEGSQENGEQATA
jgi:Leucine-rich repeat (LRR) protein